MSKNYIWVINPKGLRVEIDEDRWSELSKKGFYKVGASYKEPGKTENEDCLGVEEV